MDKKVLALLIVAVVIVGVYGSYYAYATTVIMPEDLKTFKDELNSISNDTNSTILTEDQIKMIESYNALSLMPQSTRDEMADNLTNSTNSAKVEFEEIKQNFTDNYNKALMYDLTFKGDVANEIKLAYDHKTIDYTDKLMANLDQQAIDIKSGNTTAYVKDVREFNTIYSEYNNYMQEVKGHLQTIVDKMGG